MPLDQLIWWYEELKGDAANLIDQEIIDRVDAGEQPTVSYGMLMERLMSWQNKSCDGVDHPVFQKLLPFAEQRLKGTSLDVEQPVAVLGDASFSMDVAIRTSSILASLLAAIGGGELTFFSEEARAPGDGTPKSAGGCIKLAFSTRTEGMTAPAAAIRRYLETRKIAKCFVIVSDEGENAKHEGQYFHEVFHKYYTEVYPAKLVFVSFLENNAKGQMATECERIGFDVTSFSFDRSHPDLTKLDALLGVLAVSTGLEGITSSDDGGAASGSAGDSDGGGDAKS
jgi:hypothetical protein